MVSQTFWIFAIALQVVLLSAEIHKLFWRKKDYSDVLGRKKAVNNLKSSLDHISFLLVGGW